MPEPNTVPRLDRPSPRLFQREFVARRRPVVITGFADRWPAISRWDAAYLKRTLPEAEVPIEVWERGGPGNDPADYLRKVRRESISFGHFLDLALGTGDGSSSRYLAQYPILKTAPRLLEDIRPPEEYMRAPAFLPKKLAARLRLDPALWIGPAGAVTTLHFDSTHNLFVQISGAKKVILVPPGQSSCVYYPCREFGLNLHFSPVDAEHPDPNRHPRFARATPLEVIVRPGEMLFIPATWWHYLRALEPSISINFWWNTPGTILGPPRHLLYEWREKIRRLLIRRHRRCPGRDGV
jgi:[protein]-arginine 3-hydroxylase / protease